MLTLSYQCLNIVLIAKAFVRSQTKQLASQIRGQSDTQVQLVYAAYRLKRMRIRKWTDELVVWSGTNDKNEAATSKPDLVSQCPNLRDK